MKVSIAKQLDVGYNLSHTDIKNFVVSQSSGRRRRRLLTDSLLQFDVQISKSRATDDDIFSLVRRSNHSVHQFVSLTCHCYLYLGK